MYYERTVNITMDLAFIIDLDGTLYRGNEIIPGADQWISQLRQEGIPFLLLTNNSSRTPDQVAEHLQKLGISVEPDHIFTTAQATANYLVESGIGRRLFVIGETGLQTALTEQQFELVTESPDAVVQGIDRSFNYAKLTAAVNHIRSGAKYILTNPDHLLHSDHELMPGAGSIAASIERASGVQPIVIGKPSSIIMRYGINRLGASASHTWVVGDNVVTDIAGGAGAGCRTALVLTGVATAANWREQVAAAQVMPDLVCENLREVLPAIAHL